MTTYQIESMESLVQILNGLPNCYIFRGHSNATWPLQTSLERLYPPGSADLLRRAEEWSLAHFKSKYHLYDTANKAPTSKLQWLSLMQHYGVPTRLMDFTVSPYVALYFAIETLLPGQQEDFCVYALDYRALMRTSVERICQVDSAFPLSYEQVQFRQDEVFQDTIDQSAHDILWVTEPTEVNARLDRQSGCFLLAGRLGSGLQDLLDSPAYCTVDFQQLVIPRAFYGNVYALLEKANINSKVIYGDLTGLANSIRMTLHAYH